MFDTLDIMVSFVIIIFILSLLVQSLQSIVKRLFRLKSRQAAQSVKEIFGGLSGVLPLDAIHESLGALQKKIPVAKIDIASMETFISHIMDLDSVKTHLKCETSAIEGVKSAALDKLVQEMDLVKARYASSMKQLSLLLAVLVSIALNADSLQMIEKISTDKAVRQIIVQSNYVQQALRPETKRQAQPVAVSASDVQSIKNDLANISTLARDYEGLNIGIKWSSTTEEYKRATGTQNKALFIVKKLVGILITAALISMGAPFWHDILQAVFSLKDRLKTSG